MICPNCGKENSDGVKFCGYCGTACEAAPVNETPKKKGKGGMIAAIAAATLGVLALVAGIVFFAGKSFEHTIHKTFDKPKDYYSYVEKKNFSAMSDTMKSEEVQKIMEQLKDSSNTALSETVKLKLGAKGKQFTALAKDLAGVDMSWLESVGINYTANIQGEKIKASLAPILNDSTLVNAVFMLDLKEGMVFGGFPELSEKYFGISVGGGYDFDEIQEAFSTVFGVYENMLNAVPSPEKLEEISLKYYDIIMANVDEVAKSKATLEAGDVSTECTLLTVELNQKQIKSIIKEVLSELAKDKDIEKIFKDFYASMAELGAFDIDEFYEEFQNELNDSIDKIDDQLAIDKFIMETYVDKNGEIIGRVVTIKKEDQKASIKFASAAKGDDKGFEFSATFIDNTFSVIGNGKEKGGKYNGEFVVSVDKKKYANIVIEDYDVNAAKKGDLVGTFTIKPGKDVNLDDYMDQLTDEIGNDAIGAIISQLNPSLKIYVNVDSDTQKHEFAISILGDGEEIITLSFEGAVTKGEDINMPADYIRIETDGSFDRQELIDYVKGLDLDKVIDALEKANLPEEWLGTLKQYKSMLPQLLEYGLR